MKNSFIINYCHGIGNVFYIGTFTLIDWEIKGTWTVTRGTQKADTSVVLSEDQFRDIWDGVNDVPDFKKNVVKDPDVKMDWSNNHVIGMFFVFDGSKGNRNYLIPKGRESTQFKEWLLKLKRPA